MRRYFAIVIAVGLVFFGFIQEYIKVANNHYLEVAQAIEKEKGQGAFFNLSPEERKQEMISFGKIMSGTQSNVEGLSLFHSHTERNIKWAKWLFTAVFIALHLMVSGQSIL